MAAILKDTPARIATSSELERIVSRCLAKEVRDRFPSAAAAASALRLVPQRSTVRQKARVHDSIAVLPFVNAACDADLDYLCDGVTESLINNLSASSLTGVPAGRANHLFAEEQAEPGRDCLGE
jgi:hypothetical protein